MDGFDILEWKETYSVGVPSLDEHHKYLIKLIQDLDYNIRQERGKGTNGIFIALVKYTEYHFAEEEKLMEAKGYSELEKHKKLHIDFVNKLNEKADVFSSELGLALDMIKFLNEWLINHILIQDKKYSQYLR